MRLGRSLIGALLVGTSIGCAEPTAVVERDILRAETSGGQLRLENVGTERLYYAVFEREQLALILWAASVNPPAEFLAPGSAVRIPYEEIFGYVPGKEEVVVFWWFRADANAEGFVPGEKLEHVVVPL